MEFSRETDPLFLLLDKDHECLVYYERKEDRFFLLNGNNRIFGLTKNNTSPCLEDFYALVEKDDHAILDRIFYRDPKINHISVSGIFRMINQDGLINWIQARSTLQGSGDGNRVSVLMRNVSEKHYMQAFERAERRVMEYNLSKEATLENVITLYLKLLEEILPGIKLSVLKVVHNHLENVSSPSLPELYVKAVKNFPIRDNLGSCGTAAFRKERVIVEDVMEDEKWVSLREVAALCNVRSSWSQPFFGGNGEVLGTFALYYHEPRLPNTLEILAIDRAQKIISLIFTIFSYQKEVDYNQELYQFINLVTKDAIYEYDVTQHKLNFGESINRLVGTDLNEDTAITNLDSLVKFIHPQDQEKRKNDVFEAWNDPARTTVESEYRIVRLDGQVLVVNESNYLTKDDKGTVMKFIGVIKDITNEKKRHIYRNLESIIYYAFAQDFPLEQIIRIVLNQIVEVGQFSLGEIWMVNEEATEIRKFESFEQDDAGRKFRELTRDVVSFAPGQGIPGYVWQTQAPRIWENLAKKVEFLRYQEARTSGLVSAIGIPMMAKGKVMGALLVGSTIEFLGNDLIIEVLKELGSLIGSEIVRKKQEVEMRLMFERAPEVMAVTSTKGYFSKVNPAMCKLLGYEASEIEKVPFTQFIHPDDLKRTITEYEETIDGERRANHFINRYITKDGSFRWLSWSSSEPYGGEGNVFAYARDIHEWKLATDKLKESEKRYMNLFHTSPLPILLMDIETLRFLEVNTAAISKYGFSHEEFLKLTAFDIRPESEFKELEMSLAVKREPGKPTDIGVVKHKKKNGEIIKVDVRTSDIEFNGKMARIVVASDVTETMKHIDALQEQNRIMKEIAWIQSHIVRAPLARLMGIVDLLNDSELELEDRQQFQELLMKSAKELDSIIMDIVQKANKLNKQIQ